MQNAKVISDNLIKPVEIKLDFSIILHEIFSFIFFFALLSMIVALDEEFIDISKAV